MRVQSLRLEYFRNYRHAEIIFADRQNIILGDNGQGKTNLLEALYLLSHARSHRASDDRELIRTVRSGGQGDLLSAEEESPGVSEPFELPEVTPNGSEWAKVSATLISADGARDGVLEARIRVDSGRLKTSFRWNDVLLKSRSAVLGHLPTVSFFLPDLLLLRGTPEDRRRWLDAAIVQADRRHLDYLAEFQRIRQQKNRLLKLPPEAIDQSHLMIWNTQFAAAGARVMASRLAYLSQIADLAMMAYVELSDNAERLTLNYQASAWPDELPPFSTQAVPLHVPGVEVLEASLSQRLIERMGDELRRGTCLVGPHRDDIRFELDGLAADAYGSQGQQRGVVLALKLAELQCLSATLGEAPVLLLDDVMAELDPRRQRLLLEHIDPGSQMFLTTTHPTGTWRALLSPLEAGDPPLLGRYEAGRAVFQVSAGKIVDRQSDFTCFDEEASTLMEAASSVMGERSR